MIFTQKGKTYQTRETPLGIVAQEVKIPDNTQIPLVQLNFPKIPYTLFLQIAKWQTEIAKEHASESATSLFLVDGEWQAICFHQSNYKGCMTIDTDFTTEENRPMLDAVAEKSPMHATLHNHVNGGAGQSGTDFNDEKNLYGPHITIGNLNMRKMSFHARLSVYVDGKHQFIPLSFCDIIDVPLPLGASAEQRELAEKLFLEVDRDLCPDYPEEWKGRFTIKERVAAIQTYHGAGGTYRQNEMTGEWGADDDELAAYYSKKNLSGGKGVEAGENVNVTHQLQDLPLWPNEVVFSLDFTTYENFLKSLTTCSAIVEEAAIAVCLRLKLSFKDLFEHCKKAIDEEKKKEEPKPEEASKQEQQTT